MRYSAGLNNIEVKFMITNKILSSLIIMASFWISVPPLTIAFVKFSELSASGVLTSIVIMSVFISLSRCLVEQLTPGWPKWMQGQ